MPNVLKLYLENGQTKAFKFEAHTTVKVIWSKLDSLSGENLLAPRTPRPLVSSCLSDLTIPWSEHLQLAKHCVISVHCTNTQQAGILITLLQGRESGFREMKYPIQLISLPH